MGKRIKNTPPVEPTAAQAQPVESEPVKPDPETTTTEQAPQAELTPQTLTDIINQLSQNQTVIVNEVKRLREEVSSMRGGYSQKRIDPSATPGAPQQEIPPFIQQLAPLAISALTKFLSGPEEKPRSKIAELVEAKLAARLDSMIEQSLDNISKLMDAEVEGRVLIAERKEVPQPK